MKEIKLKSRYGVNNVLTPVNIDGDELLLTTSGDTIRESKDKNGKINFIDPEGGPMLQVGMPIPNEDLIIKKIEWNKALEGYLITINLYDIRSNK